MALELPLAWCFAPDTISHYLTKVLCPLLSKHIKLCYFTANRESFALPLGAIDHLTYPIPQVIPFYHLEKSPANRLTRQLVSANPGTVWFHDIFIEDRGPEPTHASPYIDVLQALTNGQQPPLVYTKEESCRCTVGLTAKREIGFSLRSFFSSPHMCQQAAHLPVKRLSGHNENQFLPIPIDTESYPPRSLNFSNQKLPIGVSGPFRMENRAAKLVCALGNQHHLHICANEEDHRRWQQALAGLKVGTVSFHAPCTPDVWAALCDKLAVAFHLHHGLVHHGLHPFFEISMAKKVMPVVSNWGFGRYLPETFFIKIDVGSPEESQIRLLLQELTVQDCLALGAHAHDYGVQVHNPHHIAEELLADLGSAQNAIIEEMKRWNDFRSSCGKKLLAAYQQRLIKVIGGNEILTATADLWN